MRVILIIAFLLNTGLVYASPNSPAPMPPKAVTKSEPDASQHNGNVDADVRKQKFPAAIEISKSPVIKVETTDKTEKSRDYSSSEWWLVYLTGFLALITGTLAFYTARLYRATVNLGSEAKATSDRQESEMQKSLAIANKSADAAEHANRIYRDALIADQRPWISYEVTLASGLKKDVNGISLTLRFVLKNTGKSPALNVWVNPEFLAAFGEIDLVGHQRAIAERQQQLPDKAGGFGFTLFPGDQIPIQIAITLSNSDIEKFDEFMRNMNVKDITFLPPIMILGCIDYKTVFDSEHHQTGFIFNLNWMNPTNPNMRMSIPKLTDESPELHITELILGHAIIGSGYTN